MRAILNSALGIALVVVLISSMLAIAHAEGQISGKYRNPVAGYEITFPKGWSGIEFLGISVLVAPGGFDFLKPAPESQMMLIQFNSPIFKDSQNFANIDQSVGNDCKQISNRYTTVNNFRAYQVVEECTTNGKYAKTELYYFGKKDFLIGATFSGNNTSAFNKNIGSFEQSIKTLKIDKQQDIRAVFSTIIGTKAITQKIDGKSIKIETTDNLAGFKLDKTKKTLSFTADGNKKTRGLTQISIGSLLKGPFKVTLDGKNVKDFNIIEDTTTKEILVSIGYDHKTKHMITITGSG